MTREEFIRGLRNGMPATRLVRMATGYHPEIVTLGEHDTEDAYIRRGVMMAGPYMAALVALALSPHLVPKPFLDRIRQGEPAGQVLEGMRRDGSADLTDQAITSTALLTWQGSLVGSASEVFTSSLLGWLET